MSKPLRSYTEWLESAGYSPHSWLSGDWCLLAHLLSKLLSNDLNRLTKSTDGYRVSLNKLYVLADDFLGIPQLLTEGDLSPQQPYVFLSLTSALIIIKHSTDFIRPEDIRSTNAPNLSFELSNCSPSMICFSCKEVVAFMERIAVDGCIWHRRCLLCSTCGMRMRKGALKKSRNGYECTTHAIRRILDENDSKHIRFPRPSVAPPPIPKPKIPPKPKFLKDDNKELSDDVISQDSGVMLRNDERTSRESSITDMTANVQSDNPIAPPRPKRASLLLTSGRTPPRTPSHSRSSSVNSNAPTPRPRVSLSSPAPPRLVGNIEIEDYPDYLCPFENHGDIGPPEDYDESKNPFADSDDDSESTSSYTHVPILQPLSMPPPKPLRSMDISKFSTLRISEKKNRAPLPPIQKRRIGFTEKGIVEDCRSIEEALKGLDCQFEEIELNGKRLETLLVKSIQENSLRWTKQREMGEWIECLKKLLDLSKEENLLVYRWRESYLNEVHSETEYLIRCLLDIEDKTDRELSREAALTNLLLAIIDEKSKLSESLEAECDVQTRGPVLEKTSKKKSMLKKRLALISRKMKMNKS